MKSKLRTTVEKHAPAILTGVGITGMITTTVLAVKSTPKVYEIIEDRKDELETTKLSFKETISLSWRHYIPAITTGVFSTACLVSAAGVNAKRSAALAAACTLSENALREYTQQTLETVGNIKEHEIREKIGEKRIKDNPISTEEVHICEGSGEQLCYDGMSGRYFKSDMESLRRAENNLNRRMLEEMAISLNDYYYELGLKSNTVGEIVGWDVDDGMLNLSISSILSETGKACIFVEPELPPQRNYNENSTWR